MQHAEAVEHFEEVATKLYDLLKRKEDAEQSLNHYMQSKAQIEKLREQSSFINSLINQIEHVQKKVQSARHQMEKTQNIDRKSTRLNSSHVAISYAVFCLKKKKKI